MNDKYQTCQHNVYAIGDLIEGPWLAHKASMEGLRCVDVIQGKKIMPLPAFMIPACTYSFPEVASVGLTEDKALEKECLVVGNDRDPKVSVLTKQWGSLQLGAHLDLFTLTIQ